MNPILNTDSYKFSHAWGYDPEVHYVNSYGEARGGDYPETIFFGLQHFLRSYLTQRVTDEHIQEAREVSNKHGVPFNELGWKRIVGRHDGLLPLYIESVDEGLAVPTGNVLFQVRNTDPKLPWLTSYVETPLLRALWYGSTVATISWRIRNVIARYLAETSDVPVADQIDFKLNDFGARGASSYESSEIGGMAHLLSFKGTDNLPAVMAARKYFGIDMAGFSIPAAEHSTITSWGRDREAQAYANMIDQFAPTFPLIAVVSDSYDLENAVRNIWGGELLEKVKTCGSTIVVRPDSGDPQVIVAQTVEALMAKFGYTTNSKGYRVLPPYVRVIQGDGVNEKSIVAILRWLTACGMSAENVAFGMGGALLQQCNRDTSRWAMKASAVRGTNTDWRDVYKQPATDMSKQSKRGVLGLTKDDQGRFQTVRIEKVEDFYSNYLKPRYFNGSMMHMQNFDDMRKLISEQTPRT